VRPGSWHDATIHEPSVGDIAVAEEAADDQRFRALAMLGIEN